MPPKKSKDPAEPSSGGGAESTPSPAPEPEAVDPTGDTGVRPIGDAGLLRTVSEFRAAIGVEKPPPTPEKADAWRLGLEQLDLLQLQNLALELALSPAAVLGQTAAALVGILLGHENPAQAATLWDPWAYELLHHLGATTLAACVSRKLTGMEGAPKRSRSRPHSTPTDYA